jgi:hypothetical protein
MTIWNILMQIGIIYALLVQFVVIWYSFSNLVCLDQEQSGNPGSQSKSFDQLFGRFRFQSSSKLISKAKNC